MPFFPRDLCDLFIRGFLRKRGRALLRRVFARLRAVAKLSAILALPLAAAFRGRFGFAAVGAMSGFAAFAAPPLRSRFAISLFVGGIILAKVARRRYRRVPSSSFENFPPLIPYPSDRCNRRYSIRGQAWRRDQSR